MRFSLSAALAAFTIASNQESCAAFTNSAALSAKYSAKHTTSLSMDNINEDGDRRTFLSQIALTTAAATFLSNTQPALAFGGALNKANAKLSGLGLPTISKVPDGFSPLVELYGKGRNRTPLLVEFLYPSDWVVVLPNNDVNGEEGTIQAGQYSAGDTGTFYVLKDAEKVEDITAQTKEFYQNAVIKAISQKGENIYQNFKLTNLEPAAGEYKNQKYMLVDFKYELLTGAGFEVDRRGVASVSNEGNSVQVMWAASTRQRYKKTESSLRTIVSSFRVYADGLSLSVPESAEELI